MSRLSREIIALAGVNEARIKKIAHEYTRLAYSFAREYKFNMITFFRTYQLAEQLRNNAVPEKHKFLYLTIPLLTERINWVLKSHFQVGNFFESSPYRSLLFYLLGMMTMWLINSRGDNRHFLDRFICLSFPAWFKVNLLGFIYSFVTILWTQMNLDMETRRLISTVFFFGNGLLFYILIGYWMRSVSSQTRAT